MGAQLTPDGVKFNGYDAVQTKPVKSVNGVEPNGSGEITIATGGVSDISELTDNSGLLSSGGGGTIEIFYASGNFTKPAGITRLEIILVGGGASGGYSSTSPSWLAPLHGGDTSIQFTDGTSTASGGLGVIYNNQSSDTLAGKAGFLGESGYANTSQYNRASGGGSYVYGTGYHYLGGTASSINADPLGWGGGASGSYNSGTAGDGAGPNATLGGTGSSITNSGDGKMGGGGAGGQGTSSAGGGGGGAGAGGGGNQGSPHRYVGGNAGEILQFDKIVPSSSQTYSITVGAGGSAGTSGLGRGGGGGQGIVIIKY